MDTFISAYLPLTVVGALLFTGFLSCFLPIIPGTIIIGIVLLVHKIWLPSESVSWALLAFFGLLIFSTNLLDWLCAYWGAKRFGATWRGGVGAIIGVILGPIFLTPLIGFILGPAIGAIIGELLGGKPLGISTKAGFGTIVGAFVAFVIRIATASFILIAFLLNISWPHTPA